MLPSANFYIFVEEVTKSERGGTFQITKLIPREPDGRPAPTLFISRDLFSARRGLQPQNIWSKMILEEILNSTVIRHVEVYFFRIQNASKKHL